MMQFRVTHVILIGLCLMTGSAMAASTVTDLIGDKDGFGVGVLAGQEFLWTTVVPDADGTDQWRYGTQSWTHK